MPRASSGVVSTTTAGATGGSAHSRNNKGILLAVVEVFGVVVVVGLPEVGAVVVSPSSATEAAAGSESVDERCGSLTGEAAAGGDIDAMVISYNNGVSWE